MNISKRRLTERRITRDPYGPIRFGHTLDGNQYTYLSLWVSITNCFIGVDGALHLLKTEIVVWLAVGVQSLGDVDVEKRIAERRVLTIFCLALGSYSSRASFTHRSEP